MEYGTEKYGVKYVTLVSEIYHNCMMVSKDSDGGIYDKKALMNNKRWYAYINETK